MTFRLVLAAVPLLALAQTPGVDYYSASALQVKAKALQTSAQPHSTPATTQQLVKYGNDYTLIAFRNANGLAELHEHESDLYLVLDGEATIVSGGTMVDKKLKSDGEYTGSGIENGQSQVLHKGDVLHIAPNIPHQLKISPGSTFSYFVQKVKEGS